MVDSVIAGTGNSRYLRTSIPADTTWADALAMLRAGTFPIDLAGINAAGFTQVGTALNTANLLKSAVVTALGLDADATPSDAWEATLALIANKVDAAGAASAAPVQSVAGKTGAVTLDADDISYDPTDTYASGTVGKAITDTENTAIGAYPIDSISGAVASFPDGAAQPVKALSIAIDPVQSGSGDPSPNNIRPISGWTGANLTRTGKNLNPNSGVNYTTSQATRAFLKAGTYTFSTDNGENLDSNHQVYFRLFDAPTSGNTITSGNITSARLQLNSSGTLAYGGSGYNSVTFTLAVDCWLAVGFNNQIPTAFNNVQIEPGSTASTYESYSGASVTIDLDGTRYGGTLNVLTGVLTVDRVMVNKPTITDLQSINSYGIANFKFTLSPYAKNDSSKLLAISNCLSVQNSLIANEQNEGFLISQQSIAYIRLLSTRASTVTAAQTWVNDNNFTLVYYIATPQTVQLTAQQISTFYGANNIWADAGDVDVTYRADTTLYIEKLTGSTEDDMIADSAIASGKYFMVGNRLFLSTAAIAAGAQLTIGTNCVETNLAAALNAINS